MSSGVKDPQSAPRPSESAPRSSGRAWGRLAVPREDVGASLVVFLVALPLCVGVAVASGVPAELGLITGIVGGLVTGLLPGSTLQVSGPAAGLTVLVFEAVQAHGLPMLGVIVLAAGLLQLLMGALRLGRWFRATSVAVVEGMLAGIGLVIIAGQLYALSGQQAPASGLGKLAGLPQAAAGALASPQAVASLALGVGTLLILTGWKRLPGRLRAIPAALGAVVLATAASYLLSLPVATVEVQGLLDAVQVPGADAFGGLLSVGVIGTVLAFTLIASAESLFSAAAVDRLHDGPRTRYDQELMAQGAGNTVCGLLGALPMTAVIVRSSANVQAGAKTRASRVLHGIWLLLFAAALPGALALIPLPALAGILVHAGWKLLPLRQFVPLWREHRGEALILVVTAVSIVAVNMFEGVLIGLALSVVKTAWEASAVKLRVLGPAPGEDDQPGAQAPIRVQLSGNATFLRLPKILESLEALPPGHPVELDLTRLHHVDHACRVALENWATRHTSPDEPPVRVKEPVLT